MEGIKNRLQEDKGTSLVELMLVLPVYLLILGGLIGTLGVFSKFYLGLAAQWECIEEVRNIMIGLDRAVADATQLTLDNEHRLIIGHYTNEGKLVSDRYVFSDPLEQGGILYFNGQPISNLERHHYVQLKELDFQQVLPYQVQIHLVVKNGVTGREISVDTGLFSRYLWQKQFADSEAGQGDDL